jgi:hypothetical protein
MADGSPGHDIGGMLLPVHFFHLAAMLTCRGLESDQKFYGTGGEREVSGESMSEVIGEKCVAVPSRKRKGSFRWRQVPERCDGKGCKVPFRSRGGWEMGMPTSRFGKSTGWKDGGQTLGWVCCIHEYMQRADGVCLFVGLHAVSV